jgi:TolB-like protein
MDALGTGDVFLFEGFRLNRRGGGLFRRDERGAFVPVAIGSRALGILGVLVERSGDLVSRDTIITAVWPTTVVEDNNLSTQIAALRRMLDRSRGEGSCIQTVSGRGYRFTATVTRVETAAPSGATALPQSDVSARPRLSIVVLPFANLSDAREQQYFADGITDDLTTDISRIAGMFVISRNTAFTYRNKQVDTKQIGRELGVRYVLEGSVQRAGNQIRVTAQLIDAEADAHLWAERFDRDTDNLFALQNEITSRIAVALNLELIGAEATRPTEHPDALDYILRGRAAQDKPSTRDTRAEAIGLFERALTLDPQSVEAQSRLAGTLAGRALDGIADTAAADIARAEGLARQALAASPRGRYVHYAIGQVLRAQAQVLCAQGRCEEAISEYQAAIALNRNLVFPIAALGHCKLLTGSLEETIPLVEKAMRLSPRDPHIYMWYKWIGVVHLLQSRIDEAIVWLEKARTANPAHPLIRAHLASAYGLKDAAERGAAELGEARKLSSDGRFSSIARLKAAQYLGVSKVRALYETTYLVGLRKAGMPDE